MTRFYLLTDHSFKSSGVRSRNVFINDSFPYFALFLLQFPKTSCATIDHSWFLLV